MRERRLSVVVGSVCICCLLIGLALGADGDWIQGRICHGVSGASDTCAEISDQVCETDHSMPDCPWCDGGASTTKTHCVPVETTKKCKGGANTLNCGAWWHGECDLNEVTAGWECAKVGSTLISQTGCTAHNEACTGTEG
jgi:hypothetical protein